VKILLTGASGFIGSHVARALAQRGHEVHALVLPADNLSRIADIVPRLRLVEGNLLDSSFKIQPSFDCCVHLAWYVVPGKYLEAPENREFVRASLRLAQFGFPRFVAAGTCFEYAMTNSTLTESSQVKPCSLYAQCKLELFRQLQSLPHELAWVRFFYQYGPWEDERRLMPYVIRSLLRGQRVPLTPGEQVRDFLHIEDVASAVAAVAENKLTGAVNIGSAQRVTVRKIAETIGTLVGRPELIALGAQPYAADDPMFVVANNAKLKTTGWRPRISLETGLRQTVEWWRPRTPLDSAR
jgi:nucleoside-diphosphate-sugar epimerase